MSTTIGNFFKTPATQGTSSNNGKNREKAKNDQEQPSRPTTVPWVEKYRPRKVEDVVYQDEVVAMLKKCIDGADLPNLLFYGPPGTGKTSVAVALCHQLFKTPEMYKDRVLEMNASDERGIDVVRHRIKEFARLSVSSNRQGKEAPAAVALRIVILDEADAMTGPAQAALRRTMESETQSTRFFLICNYITRIIEPLTSRCVKFRFKPLAMEVQRERLLMISEKEEVSIAEDAIDELVGISGGDLRKSITLLQSMGRADDDQVTVKDVREMSGYVPGDEINDLMAAVQSSDLKQLTKSVEQFSKLGFSAYQLINQLVDVLLANDLLTADHKTKIFQKIGICEKRLLDGADEFLQLFDLFAVIQGCFFELDN